MTKKPLQIAMVILALVPIITGALSMMGIDDPLFSAVEMPRLHVLDSNLRFFGGVWMGIGLAALWLVPRITEQTALFRAIWGAIFLGGLGRLLSMLLVAMPPVPFVFFTALEVLGAPLFIAWQARVVAAKG